MDDNVIENYIKECENLEFDFNKGTTELFLREYTTFSSCLDSLSELNIKTKDDFQTKILSPMYNLSGILSNHYYYYKHYDILLNSLSKYLNYVKPENVQFFTEVYLWVIKRKFLKMINVNLLSAMNMK